MTHLKVLLSAVVVAGFTAGCGSSAKPGASGAAGNPGSAGSTSSAGSGNGGSGGAGAAVQLVSDPGCGSINLVVVDGTLYWTEKAKGTVNRIAVSGGTPDVLATAQAMPGPLAVDQTAVYWGNAGDKTVMKRPLPTGVASVFVPANGDVVSALLVDNGVLYIGRGYSAQKVATSGGTPTTLMTSPTSDLGLPGAFALDATHLYQTEISHQAISRETLDGMQNGLTGDGVTRMALAPDRLAVSVGELVTDAIAVQNGNVIWVDGSKIEYKGVDQGEHGSLAILANDAGFNPISGFAVSGNQIYLGESSDNNIQMAPLSFGAMAADATVIATGQTNPAQLAADATNLYWRTDDCKIMKLAK
jgi:hypothetical protein